MLTNCKSLLLSSSLALGIALGGCSGDKPAETPTASASPVATATAATSPTPEAGSKTPAPHISPLGGKPATEEEKEYYRLQKKAQDLVLAKDYEKAIPLLEQAAEQKPQDAENAFYLLLSHGSLEPVPSKGSAAYPFAKRVIELAPNSNEAERAKGYLIGAEFAPPKDFKYGNKTFFTLGGFVYEPDTQYKLTSDAPLHTEMNARLGRNSHAVLWETEIAPDIAKHNTTKLSKGTEVKILSESHFYYSLTSWRKQLPPGEPKEYDESIFEVNGFYVEVVSDGDNKGKKGWLVNQMDRYTGVGEDPFGVWLPDRLSLVREAEVMTK